MDRTEPPRRPTPDGGREYDDRPTQAMPGLDPDATRVQPAATSPSAPTRAVPQASRAAGTTPSQDPKKPPVQVKRLRRGRLAIRKFSPWAVLKFSLVFFFCMLLIVLLSSAIIFATLKAFGVIDNIERTLRESGYDVTLSGGLVFRWLFLLGLVGTVVMSAISMFMAFLYNLIADVVGGIEMLVTERE